ncbi:hypothetical protein BDA99DRAFT_105231 [Phascolomyces articulosus]|uniref:Uncharacterized protein n=1 Tax=Phascolomyces articulosus TaxID=60185 RepID=A0AAD5PCZ3_9FUNG|nr:hypothetical protein BDA99DRAFT_105231 [Phascolomyces articulosus]
MSGETPPGRFQSMNKKFTGSMSPGPNGHSPNGRGGHNRSRVLTSKVSAPRPINLPSLRREYASGAEWPAGGGPNNNANASSSTMNTTATTATSSASNSGTTGWGSSPSLSPFAAPQKWDTEGSNVKAAEWPTTNQSPELQSSSSPIPKISSLPDVSSPSISPHPPASSAWATVSTTSTPTLSAEFPTAAETTTQESTTTTTMNTDKNQKSDKKQTEKTSENDKKDILETENLDWDEIVRQDLENDDSPTSVENETVLPSDRFTEDYDRSYPPQIHPVNENAHLHAPPPSTHNTPYHHLVITTRMVVVAIIHAETMHGEVIMIGMVIQDPIIKNDANPLIVLAVAEVVEEEEEMMVIHGAVEVVEIVMVVTKEVVEEEEVEVDLEIDAQVMIVNQTFNLQFYNVHDVCLSYQHVRIGLHHAMNQLN